MTWVPTFTGKRLDPLDPQPEQICIADIAHALSNICRYAGHTRRFYSVAEHCIRLSLVTPSRFAKLGLLHDAAEAYILDQTAPIKRLAEMKPYRDIDDAITAVILAKYSVKPVTIVELSDFDHWDKGMVKAEVNAGLVPHPDNLPLLKEFTCPAALSRATVISAHYEGSEWGWSPKYAEHRYLDRAKSLAITDEGFLRRNDAKMGPARVE